MRVKALPTIKNKEAALRLEVKHAKDKTIELKEKINIKIEANVESSGMWNEFAPNLVAINSVEINTKKIAGVKIPILEKVIFKEEEFSLFEQPKWFPKGLSIIKELAELEVQRKIFKRKMVLLDYARRKTTQKVNLYEKVQIPSYQEAILKINRFLEDEENLSKSAQKIVKKRQQQKLEEKI